MYDFLPACNSERLAMAVSFAVEGMYNADVHENAIVKQSKKTTRIVFLEHIREE
jgi:hypothetical protein